MNECICIRNEVKCNIYKTLYCIFVFNCAKCWSQYGIMHLIQLKRVILVPTISDIFDSIIKIQNRWIWWFIQKSLIFMLNKLEEYMLRYLLLLLAKYGFVLDMNYNYNEIVVLYFWFRLIESANGLAPAPSFSPYFQVNIVM